MKRRNCWLLAFFVNLTVAMAACLPFLIRDGGYFAMTNDFAAQEIPFQMLMNDTVKSGNLLWNWAIDLGGNFLESLSFYNFGSIFTWLSFLFPSRMVPKLIGWMIILKLGVAGATSAMYLERHLTKKTVIILASMLYTFSGFQCASIVFYHFMDVIALFPLMMVGLERLVEEGKRGGLVLACVLNVLCNYVFFVGEVLFLVLFYVVKYLIPQLKGLSGETPAKRRQAAGEIWKPIGRCIMGGAFGMMTAGALLVPAVVGTLGNSRASNHIMGENWFSMSTADWLMLLKAVLVPAEPMSRQTGISWSNWYSNAAWLPLFGIVFVLAYVLSKNDVWSIMMKAGLVIAAVPVFNSAFTFFSAEAYRRWYFMLVLLMALVTGKVLENPEEYKIKEAAFLTAILYALYVFMTLIVKWNQAGDKIVWQTGRYFAGLWLGIVGIVLVLLVICFFKSKREKYLCVLTAIYSGFVLMFSIQSYQVWPDNTNLDFNSMNKSFSESIATYLTDIPSQLEQDILPYRYYFDEWIGYSYYNFAMTNSLPSINSFISTVHPAVTEFYQTQGAGRSTWTNAVSKGYRELVGAKYIISLQEEPEYTFTGTVTNSNGQTLYCYENENALPIGFTYDDYMTETEYQLYLDTDRRPMGMLNYLVVKDEDEEKVRDCLEHFSEENLDRINLEYLEEVTGQRRKECSQDFVTGNNRFTSTITADREKYAFFSVPYDKYWKAAVNGEQREILDINGMMAVRIGEGENTIEFIYDYTPYKLGIALSILGILGCCIYFGVSGGRCKKTML